MELGLGVGQIPKEIPFNLINQIADEYALSPWGAMLWQKVKYQLYQGFLVEPLQQNIVIGEELAKRFEEFSPNEKSQINKTIDKLERYIAFGENSIVTTSSLIWQLHKNIILNAIHWMAMIAGGYIVTK